MRSWTAGLVIILIGLVGPVHAATYHVSKQGSDGNGCASAESPNRQAKLTIAAGIRCLRGGDTLLIGPGTYTEGDLGSSGYGTAIPSGSSWANPTRIMGSPPGSVVIQPSSRSYRVFTFTDGHRYIELTGLIMDGAHVQYDVVKFDCANYSCHHIRIKDSEIKNAVRNPPSASGIGILGGGSGMEFMNLDVHHNTYGIYSGAHGRPDEPGVLIQGSRIHHNAGYGIHLYADGGGVDNNVVAGNTLYENNLGPTIREGDRGVAMIVSKGRNNRVCGNEIFGNRGGIQVDYSVSDTSIDGNKIHDNGPTEPGIYIGAGARNTRLGSNTNQNGLVDVGSGTQPVTAAAVAPCAASTPGGGGKGLPRPTKLRVGSGSR